MTSILLLVSSFQSCLKRSFHISRTSPKKAFQLVFILKKLTKKRSHEKMCWEQFTWRSFFILSTRKSTLIKVNLYEIDIFKQSKSNATWFFDYQKVNNFFSVGRSNYINYLFLAWTSVFRYHVFMFMMEKKYSALIVYKELWHLYYMNIHLSFFFFCFILNTPTLFISFFVGFHLHFLIEKLD
jgi:hypothetical protein